MTNHLPDLGFRREILNRHLLARGAKPDHGPIDHLYVSIPDLLSSLHGNTILANEELGATRDFALTWSKQMVPLVEAAVDRKLICILSHVPWSGLAAADPAALLLPGAGPVWLLARTWEEGTSLTIVKHGLAGELDAYEVRAIRNQKGRVVLLLVEHGRAVITASGPCFTSEFMPEGCDPAERIDHALQGTLKPVMLALQGMHDRRCHWERDETGIQLDVGPLIQGKLDS